MASELSNFLDALKGSGLAQPEVDFLSEQAKLALAQFERQRNLPVTQKFSSDRLFETSAYRVKISAHKESESAISKLLNLFRGKR